MRNTCGMGWGLVRKQHDAKWAVKSNAFSQLIVAAMVPVAGRIPGVGPPHMIRCHHHHLTLYESAFLEPS